MSKTLGISPKVYVPALGQIIVGLIFLALGLTVEGKTALATGVATFGAGFAAPPAPVVTVSTEDPVDPDAERPPGPPSPPRVSGHRPVA